jgi:hypothetical protein
MSATETEDTARLGWYLEKWGSDGIGASSKKYIEHECRSPADPRHRSKLKKGPILQPPLGMLSRVGQALGVENTPQRGQRYAAFFGCPAKAQAEILSVSLKNRLHQTKTSNLIRSLSICWALRHVGCSK